MSYKRTNWRDHVVEHPDTYNVVNNEDGTITQYSAPGEIIQQGTPMNEAHFNNMESGILQVNVAFDELLTIVQAKMRELDELRSKLNALIAESIADSLVISSVTYTKTSYVDPDGSNVVSVTYTVKTDAKVIEIQATFAGTDSYLHKYDYEKYSTVSGTVRTWTVKVGYRYNSGTRTVKFRASTDGENYGEPYSISVNFD